ncbi:MAG: ribonuclease III [Candidatus Korobacteraceae bacterium]|jgi:ribonuclease III
MKSGAHDTSALEETLEHVFRDTGLLVQALTHASYARELESQNAAGGLPAGQPDNEQMEFLGDAVLSFVISQELFRRFPEYQEGELSKLRAHIVSARRLLRPARELKIGDYLRLGRGEERSGGRNKSALLVDALEAIIAALFLDAGLDAAQRFILRNILEPELAEVHQHGSERLPVMDYKSALQEAIHASGRPQARYLMVKEEGPDHRKMFTIEAHIPASLAGGDGFVCRSEGSTKKAAEQAAARLAWERLQSLEGRSAVESTAASARVPSRHE